MTREMHSESTGRLSGVRLHKIYSLILRGKRYSAISTLSTEGVEDTYITEGTVNDEVFQDFIQKQLVPILSPFDGHSPWSVVIIDNASIHHVDSVVTTIY